MALKALKHLRIEHFHELCPVVQLSHHGQRLLVVHLDQLVQQFDRKRDEEQRGVLLRQDHVHLRDERLLGDKREQLSDAQRFRGGVGKVPVVEVPEEVAVVHKGVTDLK
jgi:hypothetical protein